MQDLWTRTCKTRDEHNLVCEMLRQEGASEEIVSLLYSGLAGRCLCRQTMQEVRLREGSRQARAEGVRAGGGSV